MPKSLDIGRLKKFEIDSSSSQRSDNSYNLEHVDNQDSRWPSREPIVEGQISIKGRLSIIRRFQAMCKDDRRTYADMLNILMDHFEGKN